MGDQVTAAVVYGTVTKTTRLPNKAILFSRTLWQALKLQVDLSLK